MDILQIIDALKIDLENLPKPSKSYSAVNKRAKVADIAIQFRIKNGHSLSKNSFIAITSSSTLKSK